MALFCLSRLFFPQATRVVEKAGFPSSSSPRRGAPRPPMTAPHSAMAPPRPPRAAAARPGPGPGRWWRAGRRRPPPPLSAASEAAALTASPRHRHNAHKDAAGRRCLPRGSPWVCQPSRLALPNVNWALIRHPPTALQRWSWDNLWVRPQGISPCPSVASPQEVCVVRKAPPTSFPDHF